MPSVDVFFPFRSKQSHTAHIARTERVHYRHHPLFGKEVEVSKRFRHASVASVMIVVADGTRGLIPQWMLDSDACSAVSDEDTPRISVSALCLLRDLLDAQTLSSWPTSDSPGASSSKGGSSDVEASIKSESVEAPLGSGQLPVEPNGRNTAETLSGTAVTTSVDHCQQRKRKDSKR
jgi:hypothetical protein